MKIYGDICGRVKDKVCTVVSCAELLRFKPIGKVTLLI